MGQTCVKSRENYPETKFIIFTGLVNATNIASMLPMQHEGAYLLGALAAMLSKQKLLDLLEVKNILI